MSDNIHGKMVYSFEKPMWHNITEPSLVAMSAVQILKERFGGGFSIELRALNGLLNGENTEIEDFMIVRTASPYDNKEVVFGTCTKRFHPLQPFDIAASFDNNVREPVETMAFLGRGEEMFISWRMPSIEVIKGDLIDLYGIGRMGFDTLKGARLFTAAVRPVCWNTINLAENWAKHNTDGKGKGRIWSGKAISVNLLRDLGYWMSHVQTNALREASLLQSFFGKLAMTPVKSDNEVKTIIKEAYPSLNDVSQYYPSELREDRAEKVNDFNERQEGIRVGIFDLFSGAGTGITPDLWGVMNSTSEYFCHVLPSKKPIAESVMFGGRQRQITSMVNTLAKHL